MRPTALRPPISFSSFNQRYRIESLASDRNRHAFFESDFNALFFVGSFLRRLRHLPRAGKRGGARVFEFSTLVAEVPEIAIAAVDLLSARAHRDPTLLA